MLLRSGYLWGALGVLAFSFTVPLTRVALEGFSPLFIGAGRAVLAAALATIALTATRARLPRGSQWARLAVVATGIVAGFPLLTTFALQRVPATHGAVVIGLLPAATAVAAVLRTREHPPTRFWWWAMAGAVATIGFASAQGGVFGQVAWSDVLLFGAVLAAAVGYAEGGLLSRELGAWQTISWALILAAPLMSILTLVAVAEPAPAASATQWGAFVYLGAVSMYLGFFAWYRGLAIGPMAQVSQVQLIQPILSITWAALWLGETITWPTAFGGFAVIACAGGAVRQRTRQRTRNPTSPVEEPTIPRRSTTRGTMAG